MKGKGTIEKTLLTGIIIAIICVLAILLISIWQSRRLQDTTSRVKHTNQVLFATEDILDMSLRYELGVKNFLITGDSAFLDSLDVLSNRLQQRLAEGKQLIRDNPEQQERMETLYRYIDKNRDLLDQAIRMHRGNNVGGAAKLIASSASFGYSHQISLMTDRLKTEESRLLNERRRANQHRASELQYVLWGLIAAVAVLAFVVIKKIRIDLAREQEVKEQLNQFNKVLEDTVRSQTKDLQASEEKYKTLFYKSPLPKWIYDQDTLQFLEVNEAAVRLYGYSQEQFKNMTIKDIRPQEDIERLLEDIAGLRTSRETYRDSNWRHLKKNGEVIDVELTAHPIEYERKRARMVIVNDITERKKAETLLQQLNHDLEARAAELAASNAELERFAYIASHDLQEPLRMVSSFLQLLQKKYKGQLDDKATQYIHFAVDGAERMKTLILDLLEYSRVGSGKGSFTPVKMDDVMKEVGETFREKIIAARAKVEIGHLPDAYGDKVQLVQLMQNLVGNALKYHSGDPPLIRVQGNEVPGGWLYSVQDNGIGIDPMFFEKIFIIFQRLHNKSDFSGTGIGLAICKKIVERHGGRIWVESSPGKGSSFFFTIAKQP
ncbi:ATP-binding protein [Flavitalea sp. BT771]|uniref:sensor histidine kinase n=1 Tax=Flavitalea sp. BT771 TaxID=3063329 RepID=UPI0026E1B5B1|nr:ATP-binding protein [Flavitalea sp. BT771]MDO6432915.1 ATP-binding protein [Flavitalea sp. BT771]MDV6221809.1 ATP-binding protein [Flavitalea sp. BT771]